MPPLSPLVRRKLAYLHQDGQAPHGAGALACWNWALTGFGPNQTDPQGLFSFASFGPAVFPLADTINGAGPIAAAWFIDPHRQVLRGLEEAWRPFRGAAADTPPRQARLAEINLQLVRAACAINGLTLSDAPTPYQVVMHYDNTDAVTGALHGPNYTHWWLRIDGGGAHAHNDGLEVFPGSLNLTIRRPQYAQNHNCDVYVTELHQAHVNVINAAVQAVIVANHANHRHVHYAAPNHTATCPICTAPGPLTVCACCRMTVCAGCLENVPAARCVYCPV